MTSLWKRVFEKWKKYQYEVHRTEHKSSATQNKSSLSKKRRCKGKELQRAHTVSIIPVYRMISDDSGAEKEKCTQTQRRSSVGPVSISQSVVGEKSVESKVSQPGAQTRRRSLSSWLFGINLHTEKTACHIKEKRAEVNATENEVETRTIADCEPPSKNNNQTPYVDKGEDNKICKSKTSFGGWNRFARKLSQKEKSSAETLRKRSSSIDCVEYRRRKYVASTWPSIDDAMKIYSKDMYSSLSSSSSSLAKSSPSPSGRRRASELDLQRQERRKSTERRGTADINALFSAVEQQDLESVMNLLPQNIYNINSLNADDMTVLDVAVLSNNMPISKLLLCHGAKQNLISQTKACISENLEQLIGQAEKRVVDLTAAVLSSPSGDNERTLGQWQFRYRLLKRMKAGYDQSRVPDAPCGLRLSVLSGTSLRVHFDEPLNHNGAIVTHYKVEWSKFADFNPIEDSAIIDSNKCLQYDIVGLVSGSRYYVRVSASNMKGYGCFTYAQPLYAVPSNWRDVDGRTPRCDGKAKVLEELFLQLKQSRPSHATEIKDTYIELTQSPAPRKRKSLKNLFTFAPKLQKSLKRGLYLACVFYNNEKLLVTAEDQLPMIEIDENFTGPSIQTDFHWLMKTSCTWEGIKSLKDDMERNGVTGTAVQVRFKILTAISILQIALGIQDLGRFYHRPVKDLSGCTVLATINNIKEPKLINLISGKWVAMSKLRRRFSICATTINDARHVVLHALPNMLSYYQLSNVRVPPGLYLGYLKLQSSVDSIRVLVPLKMPNTLPFSHVRECSNISREEWEWLQLLSRDKVISPTAIQKRFHEDLTKACKHLMFTLGVHKNCNEHLHRLYDVEVIELSTEVSFLLLLPPVEDVCVVPGQVDELTEHADYTTLPVQIFELINMQTYYPDITKRYCRLSCIADLELYLAQQAHREAFSNDEILKTKNQISALSDLQQSLDKAWKSTRWIMDVIAHARDKAVSSGLTVDVLYDHKTLLPKGFRTHNNNNRVSPSSPSLRSWYLGNRADNLRLTRFYDPQDDISISSQPVSSPCTSSASSSPLPLQRQPQSGILRVYAAYETGLAKGTSVKLHITPRTTSREVINLVVQQLNKALILKGKTDPVYGQDMWEQFCLVVVIGARERVLKDDFQPLDLQNPWTKGRLYVRMKMNVLAALQQGQPS